MGVLAVEGGELKGAGTAGEQLRTMKTRRAEAFWKAARSCRMQTSVNAEDQRHDTRLVLNKSDILRMVSQQMNPCLLWRKSRWLRCAMRPPGSPRNETNAAALLWPI